MRLVDSMREINHQIDLIEQDGRWTNWDFEPLTQFFKSIKEIQKIARKHREGSQ